MMDLPNMTLYTPANPLNAMQALFKSRGSGPMVIEGMTIEILTKIRTNYKLNLVTPESPTNNKLITKSKQIDDEVHFVKFEGFYPTFELSPESL